MNFEREPIKLEKFLYIECTGKKRRVTKVVYFADDKQIDVPTFDELIDLGYHVWKVKKIQCAGDCKEGLLWH